MKRAIHHFLWMLRRDQAVLGVYALLWAALSAVFWGLPGVMPEVVFLSLFLLLWLMWLVWIRALRMDGAVGTDVFWRTRPLPRAALMAAQSLYMLTLLAIGPVALWLVVGVRLDFTAGQWLQGLGQQTAFIAMMVGLAGITTSVRSRAALVLLIVLLISGWYYTALVSSRNSSQMSSFVLLLLALGGLALWRANVRGNQWRRHGLVVFIGATFLLPWIQREDSRKVEKLPLQRLSIVPASTEPRPRWQPLGDLLLTGLSPGQYAVEDWGSQEFHAPQGFLKQGSAAALQIHFPEDVSWYRDAVLHQSGISQKTVPFGLYDLQAPVQSSPRRGYIGELRVIARLPLSGGEAARDGLRMALAPARVDGESIECPLRLWRHMDGSSAVPFEPNLLFALHVPARQFAILLRAPASSGELPFLHCRTWTCPLSTDLPLAEALLGHRWDAATLEGATLTILEDVRTARFTTAQPGSK